MDIILSRWTKAHSPGEETAPFYCYANNEQCACLPGASSAQIKRRSLKCHNSKKSHQAPTNNIRLLNNYLFPELPRISVRVHPLPPNVHIMSFLRRQESTGATTHCSTSGYQVDGFLPSYPTKPQAVWRGPGRRNDDTRSRQKKPNTHHVFRIVQRS